MDDKEIYDFYKGIDIQNIHRSSRDAADLEFGSKDQLIKAIDLDTGKFQGTPFYMRSSYFRSRNAGGMGRGGRGGYGGGGRGRYGDSRGGHGYQKLI